MTTTHRHCFSHQLKMAWLLNFIWINVSEIFRYFVFIMPMMRQAFPTLSNIAPMNIRIFLLWGIWDILLITFVTCLFWLFFSQFGASTKHTLLAAVTIWLGIFGLLWMGLYNMGLATMTILTTALILSLLELVITGFITSKQFHRSRGKPCTTGERLI